MLTLRAIIAYMLMLLIFRLLGRSLVFQARPYDLAIQVLLGSLAANLVTETDLRLWQMLLVLASLTAVHIAVARLSLWNPLKGFFIGAPKTLVAKGQINRNNLIKENVSIEELLAALREKGYPNPADVELAQLEASGRLSLLPKPTARPATPKDLQLTVPPDGPVIPLIIDGQIETSGLAKAQQSSDWLMAQLKARGYTPGQILLATYDQSGQLTLFLHQA